MHGCLCRLSLLPIFMVKGLDGIVNLGAWLLLLIELLVLFRNHGSYSWACQTKCNNWSNICWPWITKLKFETSPYSPSGHTVTPAHHTLTHAYFVPSTNCHKHKQSLEQYVIYKYCHSLYHKHTRN